MSRAQRLLDLIQVLRQHRRAVAGAVLAEELGVSLRTIYRDIDIRKSGFERFVARAADRSSVLYGLVAVALSVGLGWLAGWIAGRRR